MRRIYGVGENVTLVILIVGMIMFVVGGLVLYGGDTLVGVVLTGGGVGFMVLAFVISFFVYMGQDIYRIRQILDAQTEGDTEGHAINQ